MKKITLLILLFILPFFVSAQNQERMSVHYFDVTDELVQDFLDFHKKRDLMFEEAGFGKDLYKLPNFFCENKQFNLNNYSNHNVQNFFLTHDKPFATLLHKTVLKLYLINKISSFS